MSHIPALSTHLLFGKIAGGSQDWYSGEVRGCTRSSPDNDNAPMMIVLSFSSPDMVRYYDGEGKKEVVVKRKEAGDR
jgi:hypothetical protein